MTESLPVWFVSNSPASESDIQCLVIEALELAGWFVTCTSQDIRTRQQLAGLPDLLAFKHGYALLVECKAPRERLNDAQGRWQARIEEHHGQHLRHVVVRHPEMIDEWLAPGRGAWKEKRGMTGR